MPHSKDIDHDEDPQNVEEEQQQIQDDSTDQQVAEEEAALVTVFEDPVNFTVKHPLQSRWTLWYLNSQRKANQNNWNQNLKKIITFETVEDFWGVFNNIIKPSQTAPGSDYHLFKEGIQPTWEDPANEQGGKWVCTIRKKDEDLDTKWLNTMLLCVGAMLPDYDQVNGVVISIRRQQDRIALWTATNEKDACERSGRQLKRVLELPENVRIGFQAHADAAAKNSSFANDDLYTV
ncbi:putative eukaryotic initiation factor 4E [Polychytrium aggregatum]|uniref:putative eukaryotic initiation factor 4E n=1 Tax=Polychytrium aggregatum TaxID=110093 RepID=UPI0022FEB1CD|nr:putative eukaryotic initiation factor 4E [Polychytrium aggregatum]KAI9205532.1 putative eukaryotic initiation factor 4E [Polychytrium aggregatum]